MLVVKPTLKFMRGLIKLGSCGGSGSHVGVNDWTLFLAGLGIGGGSSKTYKTSDEIRSLEGTTPAIDSELKATLAVGYYHYMGVIFVDSDNVAHLKYGMGGDGTQTGIRLNGAIASHAAIATASYDAISSITFGSASVRAIYFEGYIDVTAESVFGVYWSQFASNAYNTTMKKGSWIEFSEAL